MLKTALKQHGQRQFVGIGGDMGMLRIAERTGCVVHRPNHVAGERQGGIMAGSLVGEGRHIVVPFSTIDGLRGEQVWPCALPATRNRRAMEIHQQMMAGGTFQQILLVVHIQLVVAGEEINLHASHTHPLAPCKLLLAVLFLVQTVFRCGSTIHPSHGRVVPDERLHALRFCIVDGVLDGLTLFHRVPFRIDEHVRQAKGDGHIHILLDDIVVVRAMVIGPVDPRHRAGLNPMGIGYFARLADIGHQRGFHHILQTSDDGHSPGRRDPLQTSPRGGFLLSPSGELVGGHPVVFPFIIKTGSTLPAPDIRLREQHKRAVNGFEQGRETPAVVIAFCRL